MALRFLAPFVPDATHPFDERRAAHLLRRAGFGASPREISAAVDKGLEAAVEDLFAEHPDEEHEFERTFDALNGRLMNFGDIGACQAWWVYRMLTTRAPLREKLTLFWHGHFATNHEKVGDAQLMLQQIDTLRRLAWGNLRDLVLAMAKDPAMLVWLDGQSNTREHPNENFARELMELFTCGIGNYTEQDVLEAARAFTGWHRDGAEFVFVAEAHDPGPKRFLGKSGRFDGTDVIDLLMQQPATARFIAYKLLRFFAAGQPPEPVVAEAAELLDRTQLNIKWFLRELFQSQYFFSEECYRQRIASPAELVVGTVRSLNVKLVVFDLVQQMNAMGQQLLAPPNVKGWDGEQKWINSTSLAARVAFAKMIPELNAGGSQVNPHLPIDELVPANLTVPREIVDTLARVVFQGDLPAEVRRELATMLVSNEEGPQPEAFRDDPGFRESKTRGLLGVLLSLPEYQTY
jgi:hypothetical protein